MTETAGQQPAIVVGVDGSQESIQALRWADEQAARTDARLVAVTSWHVRMPGSELVAIAVNVNAAARDVLETTLINTLGEERAATVETRVSSDKPADAIVQASQAAELVVIGADAHDGLPNFPLGSVAEGVLTYSACPVAVIRPRPGALANRIVVGLDGSSASRDALSWALRQARLVRATIEAIVVWDWTPRYTVFPYGPPADEFEASAQRLLDGELEVLTAEDRSLVTGRVLRGHPPGVLIEAAKHADLLVLGRRGAGGAFRHLIGSVSSKCARHATVPVVITH
jgi:nucleotide-binding universal stress UspA family protein